MYRLKPIAQPLLSSTACTEAVAAFSFVAMENIFYGYSHLNWLMTAFGIVYAYAMLDDAINNNCAYFVYSAQHIRHNMRMRENIKRERAGKRPAWRG